MKTVVKTFMRRFAPKVRDGTKRQTVRPRPKRLRDYPRKGDRFSGRMWTGRPYNSPQEILREGIVTAVIPIEISSWGIRLSNSMDYLPKGQETRFARADGFENWQDMRKWFAENHPKAMPFSGLLIKWKPDPL